MEKAIYCVKMVTNIYISCRNLLVVYKVIIRCENRISTDKKPFDKAFLPPVIDNIEELC